MERMSKDNTLSRIDNNCPSRERNRERSFIGKKY